MATGYNPKQRYRCWTKFTKVKTFTEKPDLELAKVFMESGEFFWNSGLFVWNVNTILEAFSKFLPDISLRFDLGKEKFNTAEERDFIAENFPYCLNISIDYGIMEKRTTYICSVLTSAGPTSGHGDRCLTWRRKTNKQCAPKK